MKYLRLVILSFVAIVAARDDYEACPRSGKTLCCSSSVLNLAYLKCSSPDVTPNSAEDLEQICDEDHADPTCCSITIINLGVLCQDAEGFRNGRLRNGRGRRSIEDDIPPNSTVSAESDGPDPDDILEDISSLFDEAETPDTPEDIDDILPDVASLFDEDENSEIPEDIDDILPDVGSLFEEDETPSTTSPSPSPSPDSEGDDILSDIASLFEEHEIPDEDADPILHDIASLFAENLALDEILLDVTLIVHEINNPAIDEILPDIASLFEERRTKAIPEQQ